MQVSSIRRMSAADEAFKALHDLIMSGQLKHGDKLPPQDELARQFGVSRNTVREAINKLTVMGLLTARQGIGTLINISSPSAYMASLSDHLLLQPGTVRDFMEARVIVEVAMVRLAVLRATPDTLGELEVNVKKQKEALRKGSVDNFIALDVEFHLCLGKTSGNKVLMQFHGALTDLLGKFIREVSLLPRATQNAFAFHRDILKSISARDADGAERKVLEHLHDVVKNIEKNTGMEIGAIFPFQQSKSDPA
ncbi:MAG: FadR family transcriptional regulator [Desulfobacteraceae bacterium]|nr:FadR family transcriptional regulator [Desulfobacteraceae bacterium]